MPTIYHNNTIDPVDFDANDVLTLDGQRLFYDGTTSLFNTEIKNFARIEPHSGTNHFTVETLDGLIYEYGNSTSSKMFASGTSNILIWAVNKVSDQNGNYIEFEYTNTSTSGEYRISSIKYTGNAAASIAPGGEINFNYGAKSEVDKAFINGSYVVNNKKLDNITISYNGNLVNHYGFVYDANDENHLKTITNKRIVGGVETPLLPININWGKEDLAPTPVPVEVISTTLSNPVGPYIYSLGDFNGDGATDVVSTPSIPAPFYSLYINDKSDDFNSAGTGSTTFCSGCATYPLTNNLSRTDGKMFFDYNGDGKDDMVIVHYNISTLIFGASVEVYISSGTTFAAPVVVHTVIIPGPDPGILKIIPGDFDGDGKKEILFMQPVNQLQVVYECWLAGDEYSASFVGFLPLPTSNAKAIDFDGDGKDELLRTYDSGGGNDCEVYSLTFSYDPVTGDPTCLTSGTLGTFNLLHSAAAPLDGSKLYTGDFNGDGKTDMLSWWSPGSIPGSTGIWLIHYSDGNSFVTSFPPAILTANLSATGPSLPQDVRYFINDFNGDGKSDILQMETATSNSYYRIFYAKGFNEFEFADAVLSTVTSYHRLEVGDFNADGQADLLAHEYCCTPNKIIYFNRNNIEDVVTSGGWKDRSWIIEQNRTMNIYTRQGISIQSPQVPDLSWNALFNTSIRR